MRLLQCGGLLHFLSTAVIFSESVKESFPRPTQNHSIPDELTPFIMNENT
jgi:hypothetical protein